MVTLTAQGIPGGPINVGLIGTREQFVLAFHTAGWYPADPITFRTSLEIVGSVVLDRSDKNAPVSPLYFEGCREDLAFEKPEGVSADRRQHVRLSLVLQSGSPGNSGLARICKLRQRRHPKPRYRPNYAQDGT